MKQIPYQHITNISNGYLITPLSVERVNEHYTGIDDTHNDHTWGWSEYSIWDCDIYPDFLNDMANDGIAFGWEYVLTEDFSYFAYNFPTAEKKNNLVCYKSTARKSLPRLTKKLRLELETESSINELTLLCLGIKPNG